MDGEVKVLAARGPHTEDIRYVHHATFNERPLPTEYAEGWIETVDEREFGAGHMPDDVTRACARRMHYAAYRADTARRPTEVERWRLRYHATRDRIVLGNRKLVFGAVRKRLYQTNTGDDLVGECYLVMIRAVAAYNPWLGIRFSTYAYTCLIRALNRSVQRSASDRLAQHLSLDQIEGTVLARTDLTAAGSGPRLEEYLQEAHPLLSLREKMVLRRRFQLCGSTADPTLEKVGRELGISKERVRQVQATALEKLRHAMIEDGVE